MHSDPMSYVTAGLYWCLIVCWLIILIFYWREHRRLTALSPLIGTMLVVVFLDGARTLLESVYFGTWYTARTGLIPQELYEILAEPQYVLVPKVLNLLAALTIIGVLVRRWFPDMAAEMHRQRRTEQYYSELQTAHDELQALQTARDALTHMIVHDMRTPLTNIITGLQTAQVLKDRPDLTREMMDGALTGANRLLGMVNNLLDISKMEAGEMQLVRERFSIREAVQDALEMVDAIAREKRLALCPEMAFDARDGADMVYADREIIRRVLVNLLGNAVKFSPEGGAVRILSEPGEAGMVRVSVLDNGPGIAPEHQAHIFDKFYQVQPAAGGVAATGLGLTFCKLAVESHGGQVGVESTPGKGSRFWFTLPATE